MNDERSDQVSTPSQAEGKVQCGPGCNCETTRTGLDRNVKLAICLVVIAIAMLVLARGFARKAENGSAQAKTGFAETLPAVTPKISPVTTEATTGADQAKTAFAATLPVTTTQTPPATTEKAMATTETAQANTAAAATIPAATPKTPLVAAERARVITDDAQAKTAATPKTPLAAAEKAKTTQTNQAKSGLWGGSLTGLADLNKVAAQTQAVFIYLPKKGQEPIESVKQEIEKAAGKVQSGGKKMGCYTLDANSDDYVKVTSQIPSPCVLAMVKGGGGSAVSGKITEAKLLQALVTASRPASSGCGPSGCAPSTPGCN